MNKIGVAIDSCGIDHDKLSCALTLLKKFNIKPYSYVCTAGEFPVLLSHIFHVPRKKCKSSLRRKKISSWEDFADRVAVCVKDLQSNRDILIGKGFVPLKIKSVLNYRSTFPLLRYGKRMFKGNYIPQNSLLYSLNQMGCDKYIVLCMDTKHNNDKARCLYWDISSYEQMLRDQFRLTEFIYFHTNSQ